VDRAASAGAYGKPNGRFSTVSLDKLENNLQFAHSRLDNGAKSRAVTHTIHNHTDAEKFFIFFLKKGL